uniref:J domain-containing protein n=1 Tax=Rhabditophanes sp. KR3021 TaxID=114890 RepID=A0AC35TH08_9BILA
MQDLGTLYSLLQVKETATIDEIKIAYHSYLRRIHPDKTGIQSNQNEIEMGKFAWSQFKDPQTRRIYDKYLAEERLRRSKNDADALTTSIQTLNEEDRSILLNNGALIIPCTRCDGDLLLTVEDYKWMLETSLLECPACSMMTQVVK